MKYDVVIVGAGPAGIFTAIEMLRHGSKKKILIIEKGKAIENRACPKTKTKKCMNLPALLPHYHRLFWCGRLLGRQAVPEL